MSIKQRLHPRVKEAYVYSQWAKGRLLRNRKKTCFLLIARERTGSNLLIDLLNSHPDIDCMGEGRAFSKRWRLLFPQAYLRGLTTLSSQRVFGTKLVTKHILAQKLDPQTFLASCVADGWKLIYLHRLNHFDRTISWLVARQRGVWQQHTSQSIDPFQIQLDPQQVIEQIKRNVRWTNFERSIMMPFSYLTLEYERDLRQDDHKQTTLDRVFDYLDLPSHPVATTHKKVLPSNLSKVITNYADVVGAVRQTEFASYLDS